MKPIPEITLPARLNDLVKYCEKQCVSNCCGIDAFDFSPLHVASFVSAFTVGISESEISDWEREIATVERATKGLKPNEEGYLCTVAGMNQTFTRDQFDAFLAELRHSLRVAPKVFELSEQLRSKPAPAK